MKAMPMKWPHSPAAKPLWRSGLAAVLLALAGSAAFASGAEAEGRTQAQWQTLYQQAQQHYQSQDHAAAEQAAREALRVAEAGQGNVQPYIASSLNILALVRQQQGEQEEAVALLRRALEISEASLGVHVNTASLALNLGNALDGLQQPQQALPAYARALQITDALADASDLHTAQVQQEALASLGRVHAALGQSEQAVAYHQRLLEGTTALPQSRHAETLLRQGLELQQQGQLAQARPLLEQAVQLYQAQAEPGQTPNGSRINALSALAALYQQQNEHALAEPLHRQAVELRRAANPQDPALAGHLNELALWHWQRKEYEQARPLLEQALELARQHQGDVSLPVAHMTSNLAQLEGVQGHESPSKTLHQQALALFEQLPREEPVLLGQAQTLNFLAGFDYRKRRFGEAEAQFLQALNLLEQAVGTEDERLLPVLENLETLKISQGRSSEAAQYRRRVERIKEAQKP